MKETDRDRRGWYKAYKEKCAQNVELAGKVGDKSMALDALRKEHAEVLQELEDTKNNRDRAISENKRISAIVGMTTDYERLSDDLNDELTNLRKEHAEVCDKLNRAQAEIYELKDDVETNKWDFVELETKYEKQRDAIAQKNAVIETMNNIILEAIKND